MTLVCIYRQGLKTPNLQISFEIASYVSPLLDLEEELGLKAELLGGSLQTCKLILVRFTPQIISLHLIDDGSFFPIQLVRV